MAGKQKEQKFFDKPLPQNLNAERAVLGAMLLDSSAAPRVFSVINGDEFFLDQHKNSYRAMRDIFLEGKAIDLVTLSEELDQNGMLESAGGSAYLSQLMDGMPRGSNVEHYAGIVVEKFKLRNVIQVCYDLLKVSVEAEQSSAAITERAIQKLLQIDASSGVEISSWYASAQSAVAKMKREHDNPASVRRVYFGIEGIDEATGGMRTQELVMIVGPTSSGKSLLAEQMAVASERKAGLYGIYFSAEMTKEQLAMRELAFQAGVKFYFTRRPEKMWIEEIEKIEQAATEQKKIEIVTGDITQEKIWAISEAQKRSKGLDFVIVDYDQLVIEAGIDLESDEDEKKFFAHQRRFIFNAKRLAKRLDICFIMLCQLRKVPTRVAQGGKPSLDDIFGVSAVRNHPSFVFWISRDYFIKDMKPEFEKKATCYILKARDDKTCRVPLEFDPDGLRYLDAPPEEKDSVEEKTPRKSKEKEKEDDDSGFTFQ